MPVKELGSVINRRTSWGRIQIKQIFGYDLIKANYSALDLSKIAWEHESESVGFGPSSVVIAILDAYFSNGSHTLGCKSYMLCLKTIWEENVIELEYNSTPEEFCFTKRLFNKMKAECVEGTTIGKNQIIKALYTHALDLLDHI